MTRNALRYADTQPPVAQRYESAKRHCERTDPHPRHQRMIVETHCPSTAVVGFADRNVQVGNQIGSDPGGRRLLLAHRIKAPLAEELAHRSAITGDLEGAALGFIVRTRHLAH
jgi:hypothetical protein